MRTYRSDFGRTEVDTYVVQPNLLRRTKSARKNLHHRSANGVYDPITFYHVLDGLLQVEAWQPFRAIELVTFLREHQPRIIWDPVTVGRILNDIAESLRLKGQEAIRLNRRWNGATYEISDNTTHRQAMVDLMEDMFDLAEADLREESRGTPPKRVASPLERAASLA